MWDVAHTYYRPYVLLREPKNVWPQFPMRIWDAYHALFWRCEETLLKKKSMKNNVTRNKQDRYHPKKPIKIHLNIKPEKSELTIITKFSITNRPPNFFQQQIKHARWTVSTTDGFVRASKSIVEMHLTSPPQKMLKFPSSTSSICFTNKMITEVRNSTLNNTTRTYKYITWLTPKIYSLTKDINSAI